MPPIDKTCSHSSYQILETRFNKHGLRRRRLCCNLCGHRWLVFAMTPTKDPWPWPEVIPAKRPLAA